jgi:hypothetical protein
LAYVLDGSADRGVRIAQTAILLELRPAGADGQAMALSLSAVPNALTGETVGDTSEFRGDDERLRALERFDARVRTIEIRGQVFENVRFSFPEGNEGEPGEPE